MPNDPGGETSMQAVIISVGDELLSGAIVDTNAAWLSEQYQA